MQAFHSHIYTHVWIDDGIFTTELWRCFKQCLFTMQSTDRPAVSADHGVSEQRPHGLPVVQKAWDPSGYFLQLGKPSKKAWYDIPNPVSREELIPPAVQKVVKQNLSPKTDSNPSSVLSASPIQEIPEQQPLLAAMIEISLGRATIRIANGMGPAMLDRILSLVKGFLC